MRENLQDVHVFLYTVLTILLVESYVQNRVSQEANCFQVQYFFRSHHISVASLV